MASTNLDLRRVKQLMSGAQKDLWSWLDLLEGKLGENRFLTGSRCIPGSFSLWSKFEMACEKQSPGSLPPSPPPPLLRPYTTNIASHPNPSGLVGTPLLAAHPLLA